jgi:hypothetical protein
LLRWLKLFIALVVLAVTPGVLAQTQTQLSVGDPPVAALIQVSQPDADGQVTITGAAGAVFPSAQVAVRNLYTGDVVYVQAGITGTFSAVIYGPGNTPFWISPSTNIPNNIRDVPGSLPGGPGTIIYGPFPQIPAQTGLITQLLIDGDAGDWNDYASAALVTVTSPTVYALMNRESLYVTMDEANPPDYTQISLQFSLDGSTYALALDPRQQQPALLRRVDPTPADLGTLPVAAFQGEAIEFRIPLLPIEPSNPSVEIGSLISIDFLAADGTSLSLIEVGQSVPVVDEGDGIVRLNSQLDEEFTRFTVAGTVAGGASRWLARGRINSLSLNPGDALIVEMDITLTAPDFAADLVGLELGGELRLQPLAGADGRQRAGGLDSNNGWSDALTPGGVGIINLRGDFTVATTTVPVTQVIRQGDDLVFPITFEVELPDDLPSGMYVPIFQGVGQVGDGDSFRWGDNSILATGQNAEDAAWARLPVVLSVDGVTTDHMLWTLFQDNPSDGSRGLLANEDRDTYALSNRVHFDSPTYILSPLDSTTGQPIAYPIEPYLLNQLPNTYTTSDAPLIPFFFPGGRLIAQITRPDGQVDDLGSSPIFQNQLSTIAQDDRVLFGEQSLMDVYRLTTLNQAFTDYVFTQYGQYQIELTGNLEDVWGNRYEGGGTYSLLIAEPLDILPGVLPGTPFEVGDAFNAGLHLSPAGAADVTITARIYPLDGADVIEHTIEGQADRAGYFQADGFTFEAPGEYVVDYEVRYTAADGRLWAGSLRSAGVIADPEGGVIAHGERGVDNYPAEMRPAWFNTRQYIGDAISNPRLSYPYHTGDVAWIDQGRNGQLKPIIQVQDMGGLYTQWLTTNASHYVARDGSSLGRLSLEGELPLTSFDTQESPDIYGYVSAVTPGFTVRQFVQGGQEGGLLTYWDNDDPLNGQSGTGLNGMRAGDYTFLFGGAVMRGDVNDTAIYGALAIAIDAQSDPLGTRIYPPYRGEAGGANGGPLLTVREQPVNMFFHPTGVRPGDVLEVGDTFSLAGQVAPTLASIVSVKITDPNGVVRSFAGTANSIGHFYDPTQDFAVDIPGLWTVEIRVRHEGETSAGLIEPPPPTGDVLGTPGGRFSVFVVPRDTQLLQWDDKEDQPIPAGVPYNFNFPLPGDWSNVQVYHVITIPGYVLVDEPLRATGRSFSFQYNQTNLSKDFPNLENNGQGSGAAASDVVTLTLVATGVDADGQFQILTRTFTIAHDRLTTFG